MKRIREALMGILICGSLVFASSCTKDSGPITLRPKGDTLSFADTILPLLIQKCYSCHPGYANLDLGATNGYADLVNVTAVNYAPYLRVAPFDPENSVLYLKVAGHSQFGTQMPLYDDPLSAAEIWLIYDWIAQGALNN